MGVNRWARMPSRPFVNRAHPLNQGLLAAWLFWERGVEIFSDLATNNTLQLGTVWTGATVSPNGGCGVQSNGFGGYGIMSRVPKLGSGDFSIFALINKTGTGSRRGIVSYGGTGTANGVNLYVNSSDKLAFDLSNVGGPVSSTTVPVNTWIWVGCTCLAGVVQLWIDYLKDGSTSSMSPNITDPGSARGFVARDLSPSVFNGAIGEVRIWGRALPPRAVFDLWRSDYSEFQPPRAFGVNQLLSAGGVLQSAVSMM